MIDKFIKAIILALVLALVYWCATLVIGVIHAPPIFATIVLVLLVLCFAAWLLRSFNIVACLMLSFLFLTSCNGTGEKRNLSLTKAKQTSPVRHL